MRKSKRLKDNYSRHKTGLLVRILRWRLKKEKWTEAKNKKYLSELTSLSLPFPAPVFWEMRNLLSCCYLLLLFTFSLSLTHKHSLSFAFSLSLSSLHPNLAINTKHGDSPLTLSFSLCLLPGADFFPLSHSRLMLLSDPSKGETDFFSSLRDRRSPALPNTCLSPTGMPNTI